jgi:CubicO group peptidase (beta-lactamase class C family)
MLTSLQPEPRGRWEPRFEQVVRAFSEGVPSRPGAGAALSIWHNETEVVNVWAGEADARDGKPWTEDTTTMLFSSTKGLAALAVALLANEGRLDYDARVADVWPEFAVQGKGAITIRDVLAHRAGLPAPERSMTVADLIDSEAFATALAEQPPLWPNSESHLYHALTWGPLVREIVRRATGEDVAEVFRRRIAQPLQARVELQAIDDDLRSVAHISVATEHEAMVSKTIPFLGALAVKGITAGGALPLTLATEAEGANDPRIQKSGLLSMTGIGTASGLARIWSAVAAPESERAWLSQAGLNQLVRPHSEGASFGAPTESPGQQRWGAGVQLASPMLPWLSAASFGHDGAGGQMGFADPAYRIGLGYVTNYMHHTNRVGPIIEALRLSIG